jgi:hypothetical protein
MTHQRDGVCGEDCWFKLFQGNKYDYKTGKLLKEKNDEDCLRY